MKHRKGVGDKSILSAPTPPGGETTAHSSWPWVLSLWENFERSKVDYSPGVLSPSLDVIRIYLHVLAASVWVGGQIVLAGTIPGLRKTGPEATGAAARGFAIVAWPAFLVSFITGIWHLLAQDRAASSAYNVTLGIKILLVVVAGFSAVQHRRSENRAVIAATGAIGGIVALVILFFGVLLSHGA